MTAVSLSIRDGLWASLEKLRVCYVTLGVGASVSAVGKSRPACAVRWSAGPFCAEWRSPRPGRGSRSWPEVGEGRAWAGGSRSTARRRRWSLGCGWTRRCTGSLVDRSPRSSSTAQYTYVYALYLFVGEVDTFIFLMLGFFRILCAENY